MKVHLISIVGKSLVSVHTNNASKVEPRFSFRLEKKRRQVIRRIFLFFKLYCTTSKSCIIFSELLYSKYASEVVGARAVT